MSEGGGVLPRPKYPPNHDADVTTAVLEGINKGLTDEDERKKLLEERKRLERQPEKLDTLGHA